MSFANTTLLARLGGDPVVREAGSTSVAEFSVATTRRGRDRDGKTTEQTTWWRVQVWGTRAQVAAQYLHKGDQVVVNGIPNLRAWTDRDGAARQTLELLDATWAFAQPKAASTGRPTEPAAGGAAIPANDEPPF